MFFISFLRLILKLKRSQNNSVLFFIKKKWHYHKNSLWQSTAIAPVYILFDTKFVCDIYAVKWDTAAMAGVPYFNTYSLLDRT